MIERKAILDSNPVVEFFTKRGHELKRKAGDEWTGLCPFHADKSPSMTVNAAKGVFHCFACGAGGTVIDYVMRMQGLSVKDAIASLADEAGLKDDGKEANVARYVYRDGLGRPKMAVDRIEQGGKKRFVQYQAQPGGTWTPGVKGVQRVLFRLDKWAGCPEVALVEGEKCVGAMETIGISATCNPGGSNGWIDSYAEYLKDKHVDIWPDNDEAGEKWLESVLSSLEGKVASLRVMRVPPPYNDVADLVIAKGDELGGKVITEIMADEPRITRGVSIPLLSSEECYALYRQRISRYEEHAVDLGKWLPEFRHEIRPLLPGDLGLILGDTGTGKTTILSNIARSQRPMVCIFFQFELAPEPMCERFIAMSEGNVSTAGVEAATRRGELFDATKWDHIYLCPDSKLTVEGMESIVMQAELKTGEKPGLVLVDYIGLMGGAGNRYERMSNAAEGLKQMARRTETVVIIASQLHRDKERQEVKLHSGKDSGSIENSSQLVLGAWRESPDTITFKILKQTKKSGQAVITAKFDGDHQLIVEAWDDPTTHF